MTRFTVFTTLLTHLRDWPVDSQQTARRNAMLACTALAQRRAEREDVDDFFASLAAAATSHAGAASG
jgi:hypothetical protein